MQNAGRRFHRGWMKIDGVDHVGMHQVSGMLILRILQNFGMHAGSSDVPSVGSFLHSFFAEIFFQT